MTVSNWDGLGYRQGGCESCGAVGVGFGEGEGGVGVGGVGVGMERVCDS